MEDKSYKALQVEEASKGQYRRVITEKRISDLPEAEVLVRVKYSSLNYKDALSAVGNKAVTRHYPHTPGIDAAGIVEESEDKEFSPGEEVIVTSYDLGMNTPGGFGQYIRVPGKWIVRRPENLSLKESMIYGTAGFTAGLSVYKMTSSVGPDKGEILVSGGSGGVGTMAISFLVKSGYRVVAISGKTDDNDYLNRLGAAEILSIEAATDLLGKPLLKERWAGVIDTVGGDILSTAIRSSRIDAHITCCGNAASGDLDLTVYPFILRGITLHGIDSQHCPMNLRKVIWQKLGGEWKLDHLQDLSTQINLEDLDSHIKQMLDGRKQGRTLVSIS